MDGPIHSGHTPDDDMSGLATVTFCISPMMTFANVQNQVTLRLSVAKAGGRACLAGRPSDFARHQLKPSPAIILVRGGVRTEVEITSGKLEARLIVPVWSQMQPN